MAKLRPRGGYRDLRSFQIATLPNTTPKGRT